MSNRRVKDSGAKRQRRILIPVAVLVLILFAIGSFFAPQIILEIEYQVFPLKYTDYVKESSEEFGVDEAVIYAVIKTESSFRPDVTSSAGARGLMQMIESAFDWSQQRYGLSSRLNFDEAFDPKTNIKFGTHILKLLFDEFGDKDLVFAAYHAGRGNVIAWLQNPEYSKDGVLMNIPADTRHYVNKVNRALSMYQKLYGL